MYLQEPICMGSLFAGVLAFLAVASFVGVGWLFFSSIGGGPHSWLCYLFIPWFIVQEIYVFQTHFPMAQRRRPRGQLLFHPHPKSPYPAQH
jgi:hypothetical protein